MNNSFATAATALNTLPSILLSQERSTFNNKSTTEVCNSTEETSVGLSEGHTLHPKEQCESESIKLTGKQCNGGAPVKEKQVGIDESPNSDKEKCEANHEIPTVILYKTKKKNLTRNAGCSLDVFEGDDEFSLSEERRKRKELVQKAIKQSSKPNPPAKASFGGRGRGKRPNFDSKHKSTGSL